MICIQTSALVALVAAAVLVVSSFFMPPIRTHQKAQARREYAVLAGSLVEFERWVAALEFATSTGVERPTRSTLRTPYEFYRFIRRESDARGYTYDDYIIIGTFSFRPDAEAIEREIRACVRPPF